MAVKQTVKTPSGMLEVFEVSLQKKEVIVKEVLNYENVEDYIQKAELPFIIKFPIGILKYFIGIVVPYFVINKFIDYLMIHQNCEDKFTFIIIGAVGMLLFICIIIFLNNLYQRKMKRFINRGRLLGGKGR